MFYANDAQLSDLTWLLRCPLARAPYIVLFDLKPLIEDGNLQVYMYCVHVRKRASGAPRTHFRACKISKFPGGMPPDPTHTIHFSGPHFLYLPWAPPILSAALGVIYDIYVQRRFVSLISMVVYCQSYTTSDFNVRASLVVIIMHLYQ